MPTSLQIRCINRSKHLNPYERILRVGGVHIDNQKWTVTEAAAVALLDRGELAFHVVREGRTVSVVVGVSPHGEKYLKTIDDADQPEGLLSLPECT